MLEQFTDLREVAGHDGSSHCHVLEQFGRRTEELAAVGVRYVGRGQYVASGEMRRALLLWYEAGQDHVVLEARFAHACAHLAHAYAIADHEKAQTPGDLVGRVG